MEINKLKQPDMLIVKGPKAEDPPQEEPTISSRGRETAGQRLFLIFSTPRRGVPPGYLAKEIDKTNHERSEYQTKTKQTQHEKISL